MKKSLTCVLVMFVLFLMSNMAFAQSVEAGEKKVFKKPTFTCGELKIQFSKGEFFPSDKFTGYRFSLGENFKKWFLSKVEVNNGGVKRFKIQQLTGKSVDKNIITELGGVVLAETSLTAIWSLRNYLDIEHTYVFYIKDSNGKLRNIRASYDNGVWSLEAYSMGSYFPYKYAGHWGGDLVVSPKY